MPLPICPNPTNPTFMTILRSSCGNSFPSTDWHRSPAALPPRQDRRLARDHAPALAKQNVHSDHGRLPGSGRGWQKPAVSSVCNEVCCTNSRALEGVEMVANTHLRLVAPTTEKQTVAPDMIRRRPTALSRAPDGGRSRAPDRRRERRPLGPSRQRDDLGRLSLLALIPALTASITSFRISYRSRLADAIQPSPHRAWRGLWPWPLAFVLCRIW